MVRVAVPKFKAPVSLHQVAAGPPPGLWERESGDGPSKPALPRGRGQPSVRSPRAPRPQTPRDLTACTGG